MKRGLMCLRQTIELNEPVLCGQISILLIDIIRNYHSIKSLFDRKGQYLQKQ